MRVRLILAFGLVALIPILAITIFARLGVARQVESYMTSGGMVGLDGLVSSLRDYYTANQTWEGANSLLQTTHGNPGRGMGGMMAQRLRLIDADRRVVYDTANVQSAGTLIDVRELADAAQIRNSRGRTIGYLWAEGGMGGNSGSGQRLVERLNNISLLSGAFALAIAVILALLLGSWIANPLQKLEKAANQMARGDLSQRVAVSGSDELAALGQSFNQMAQSLQESEARRQAMTADIAHELRTPLAVQRAQMEAMQDGIYPLDAAGVQVALDQNTLLSRLVEDLRILALADAKELRLENTTVDLRRLAANVLSRFEPAGLERSIRFSLEAEQIPTVRGDPLRIEQILTNLLANALRFAPQGGLIHIAINHQGDSVSLSVHDSGPGIPESVLPHLFERFYRADRSRSRDVGGSGLGLAIARQLAILMGGSLSAANHPLGGAVFTLVLPVQA